MTSNEPGSPIRKLRDRLLKIGGATLVIGVLSALALSYSSERIHRYIAGEPEDTVVSRTTAEPGMVLARRGYDLTIPGEVNVMGASATDRNTSGSPVIDQTVEQSRMSYLLMTLLSPAHAGLA